MENQVKKHKFLKSLVFYAELKRLNENIGFPVRVNQVIKGIEISQWPSHI
jgi:hypothetical protein